MLTKRPARRAAKKKPRQGRGRLSKRSRLLARGCVYTSCFFLFSVKEQGLGGAGNVFPARENRGHSSAPWKRPPRQTGPCLSSFIGARCCWWGRGRLRSAALSKHSWDQLPARPPAAGKSPSRAGRRRNEEAGPTEAGAALGWAVWPWSPGTGALSSSHGARRGLGCCCVLALYRNGSSVLQTRGTRLLRRARSGALVPVPGLLREHDLFPK